jgi:hypothetical protein
VWRNFQQGHFGDSRKTAKAAAHIVSWIYEQRFKGEGEKFSAIPKRHAHECQIGNGKV